MVATLVLLDDEAAFLALPVVQVVLKKLHFLLIALPLVGSQEALPAEFLPARVAHHHAVHCCLHYSFTVLAGAQFGVGVLGHHLELVDFLVVFLNVSGQVAEEGRAHLHDRRTALGGAVNLFKIFDLVDGVVVQAGLAEGVLVLAVAEVDLLVLLPAQTDLALADLAGCDVLHAVDGAH